MEDIISGVSILVTALWESVDMISLASTKWNLVVIFALSLLALRRFKLNPVWVMLLSGVLQVAISFIGGVID